MISEPLNDFQCLDQVTMAATTAIGTEAIRELAGRFKSPKALARWIRSLPQRNDDGRTASDEPRVDCDVPQRLRLPADDPNCVERSALYLAAAEYLDPMPERQLATIATPLGRHTFPIEEGVPVVLDPAIPRNALSAGLHQIFAAELEEPGGVRDAKDALSWVLELAGREALDLLGANPRLRNAERALTAMFDGESLPRNAAEDLGFALALANSVADYYGDTALDAVEMSDWALRRLLRRAPRNLSIKLGGATLKPNLDILKSLGKVGSNVAVAAGSAYLQTKLGAFGLTPTLIRAVERELNREGLSLGALSKPRPAPGTLAALTNQALAARRRQRRR